MGNEYLQPTSAEIDRWKAEGQREAKDYEWYQSEEPPWLLSLMGEEYGLGGLIDKLGFSGGAAGLAQKFEREVGTQIYGKVAGYEKEATIVPGILKRLDAATGGKVGKLGETIKNTKLIQGVSYHLRLGHLDALRSFQEEHGLLLVEKILNDYNSNPQPGELPELVRQLEGSFEAMPDSLKEQARERVRNDVGYPRIVEYLTMRPLPLEVPNKDRLFEQTVTIPTERQVSYKSGGIPKGALEAFQGVIKRETLTRLATWGGTRESR